MHFHSCDPPKNPDKNKTGKKKKKKKKKKRKRTTTTASAAHNTCPLRLTRGEKKVLNTTNVIRLLEF